MQATISPIVETYSRLAKTYDDDLNQQSCWGRSNVRTQTDAWLQANGASLAPASAKASEQIAGH